MPSANDEELVIRGPVLVPMGWLIAIFAAAVSAVGLAITIALAYATMSTKVEAQAGEVNRLRDWRTTVSSDITGLKVDVVQIKTMLQYQFPDAAREAAKRVPVGP